MRIVAGKWRGRQILVPDTKETRPTMDRTRQAVFNILRSAAWALGQDGAPLLNGAKILDVFAGSGAMGFEALSQGATEAIFFESGKAALDVIRRNIDKLDAQASVIAGGVEKAPMNTKAPAALAFLDPPYEQELVDQALKALFANKWIAKETLLVIETRKNEDVANVDILDTRLYGMSKMTFAKLA